MVKGGKRRNEVKMFIAVIEEKTDISIFFEHQNNRIWLWLIDAEDHWEIKISRDDWMDNQFVHLVTDSRNKIWSPNEITNGLQKLLTAMRSLGYVGDDVEDKHVTFVIENLMNLAL